MLRWLCASIRRAPLGEALGHGASRYVRRVIDPGKWQRLQQWCADATALDAGHSYHALFIREEDWERYKPKSFHDAIAAFSA